MVDTCTAVVVNKIVVKSLPQCTPEQRKTPFPVNTGLYGEHDAKGALEKGVMAMGHAPSVQAFSIFFPW